MESRWRKGVDGVREDKGADHSRKGRGLSRWGGCEGGRWGRNLALPATRASLCRIAFGGSCSLGGTL